MNEDLERLRFWWDEDAPFYDRAPNHSLVGSPEAPLWRAALQRWLPPPPARVLDVGAGTGAMSLLAIDLGHEVTALDLSSEMAARAREKAAARGVDLAIVIGPASEPPPGPFDAVIERHVIWTVPDHVGALRAWRTVTRPGGRLVLFEGVFNRSAVSRLGRDAIERVVTRRRGDAEQDHHAPYDPVLLASLPLARARTMQPLLRAVREAGWKDGRAERLRDIERARRAELGFAVGWLRNIRRYAVIAEA
jgi:SAM-dependent methyltransferase